MEGPPVGVAGLGCLVEHSCWEKEQPVHHVSDIHLDERGVRRRIWKLRFPTFAFVATLSRRDYTYACRNVTYRDEILP